MLILHRLCIKTCFVNEFSKENKNLADDCNKSSLTLFMSVGLKYVNQEKQSEGRLLENKNYYVEF